MRIVKTVTLAAALLAFAVGAPQSAQAGGAETFSANKCTECHYTKGPAQEKSIADQLAKKGPELWYAGDKFQKPWLTGWLADPQPIRPLKYNSITEKNPGNHPKLSGGDAAAVSDFLMSLTTGKVQAGIVKAKKNVKGKQIFQKKMPCSGCHQYPDKKGVKGGLTAPSLVGASQRLNPDWILTYLKESKFYKPFKMMPDFAGLMREKDMKNVAGYVAHFK